MSTKKTAQPKPAEQMSAEELAKAQAEIKKQMSEKFGKWIEMLDEEATPEYVEQVKKEFEDGVNEYKNRMYQIHEADDTAIEYPKFIKSWNEKWSHWEKGQWKGVIALNKMMTAIIEKMEAASEPIPFEIDYSTLFYLFTNMSEPAGYGLESALAMAELENFDIDKMEIRDNEYYITYSNILQEIHEHIRNLSNVDKKLKLMRERINFAVAGIKFNWKISELEEFIELHDAWLGESIEDDIKAQGN